MSDTSTAPVGVNKLYFAAWRWHFFAGLYVIPFVLMLAFSGFFIMVFTTYLPEYGDRIAVEAAGEAMRQHLVTLRDDITALFGRGEPAIR